MLGHIAMACAPAGAMARSVAASSRRMRSIDMGVILLILTWETKRLAVVPTGCSTHQPPFMFRLSDKFHTSDVEVFTRRRSAPRSWNYRARLAVRPAVLF